MTARCEQRAALPAGLWLFVGTIPHSAFPLSPTALALEHAQRFPYGVPPRVRVTS